MAKYNVHKSLEKASGGPAATVKDGWNLLLRFIASVVWNSFLFQL
jgi:hypothetical protein